jgi:hypothetical protein
MGIVMLFPCVSNGESGNSKFNPREYSSQECIISHKDIQHGDILISITQAKRISRHDQPPYWCRAWLDISKSSQSIYSKYFDNIEAVGFSYGIFVPTVQPPSPYLAIVKNGDYDGRLFLVLNDGKVIEVMGGFYFMTDDKHYLFSIYASDSDGLSVFDLKIGQTVFSSKDLAPIYQWYTKDGVYFFTESEWLPVNKGFSSEKEGVAYFYDINTHKLIQKKISASEIATARKVQYDFDPRNYDDCSIAPNKRLQQTPGGTVEP